MNRPEGPSSIRDITPEEFKRASEQVFLEQYAELTLSLIVHIQPLKANEKQYVDHVSISGMFRILDLQGHHRLLHALYREFAKAGGKNGFYFDLSNLERIE